ncbi:MAG: hypothetical protein GY779_16670 [Gammaproteobacteria bacterium]|nr:hypothetical protein [Gammaproteobacteria bacterium]
MKQTTLKELNTDALHLIQGGLISFPGFPYTPRPLPAPIKPLESTDDEVLVAIGQPA